MRVPLPRGWRLWLAIAVALVVALRVAAPYAIRWAVESEGTKALGVPVRVADVDLWLVFGGIEVEGLRVGQRTHALDVLEIDPKQALFSWSRAYAQIGWLDLPFGRIHIRDFSVDDPSLLLVRQENGRIDPLPSKPREPATTEPAEPEEEGEGTPILLDRLAIRGADLRLLSTDPTRPGLVEFLLEEFTVTDFGSDEQGEISLGGVGLAGPRLRVLRDFAFEGAVPPVGPEPEAEPAAAAPPAPVKAPAAGRGPNFAVKRIAIERAEFTLVMDEASLDVALGLLAENVTAKQDTPFPVKLTLEVAEGKLEVDAKVGVIPIVFDGDVRWQGLHLPPLLAALGPGPASWVRSGVAGGDLHAAVTVAPLAETQTPARVSGTLSLADLLVHDPRKDVVVAWDSLDVAIDEARAYVAPGVGPPEIELASVRLKAPAIAYAMPSPAIDELTGAPATSTDTAEAAAAPATPDVAAAPPSAPASDPKLSLGVLEISGGRVDFTDRTVEPALRSELRQLSVGAKGIRWPQRDARDLRVHADLPGKGKLDVKGGLRAGSGQIELALDRMGLTPFNPYATSYGGVAIDSGATTLVTKLDVSPTRIVADNKLVLHQLGVSSTTGSAVVPGVGMPIDLALALLRDPQGDISLPVPVTVERGEAGVDLGAIIGGAVKAALMGALQSPLKGIGLITGAITGGDEEVGMEPIRCLAGAREPADDEKERIGALAEILLSRPGLGIQLAGRAGPDDVSGLAERVLVERIQADDAPELEGLGFFQRRRISNALEERASGGTPELDAEDAAALERWIAAVEVPPDRFAALAGSRAEALRARLVADHGVADARVVIAAAAEPGDPGVVVSLAAAPAVPAPLSEVSAPPPPSRSP